MGEGLDSCLHFLAFGPVDSHFLHPEFKAWAASGSLPLYESMGFLFSLVIICSGERKNGAEMPLSFPLVIFFPAWLW